jgi:peptide/nickel transport system substrate-binding protein
MPNKFLRTALAVLATGVSASALYAQDMGPPPEAPKFDAQGEPVFVDRAEIYTYRALPSYAEPDWVTKFVEAGKLPPVAERLPKEPLVFEVANMPDGAGAYGDVMRHVIGGRPEGWNFWAGQSYGWGGIDIGMVECLTRTGPLFQVNAEDLQPLPQLAKSWDWSDDGKTLTVHLIEGAKWSDGDPFDTEDIAFYYDDIVSWTSPLGKCSTRSVSWMCPGRVMPCWSAATTTSLRCPKRGSKTSGCVS